MVRQQPIKGHEKNKIEQNFSLEGILTTSRMDVGATIMRNWNVPTLIMFPEAVSGRRLSTIGHTHLCTLLLSMLTSITRNYDCNELNYAHFPRQYKVLRLQWQSYPVHGDKIAPGQLVSPPPTNPPYFANQMSAHNCFAYSQGILHASTDCVVHRRRALPSLPFDVTLSSVWHKPIQDIAKIHCSSARHNEANRRHIGAVISQHPLRECSEDRQVTQLGESLATSHEGFRLPCTLTRRKSGPVMYHSQLPAGHGVHNDHKAPLSSFFLCVVAGVISDEGNSSDYQGRAENWPGRVLRNYPLSGWPDRESNQYVTNTPPCPVTKRQQADKHDTPLLSQTRAMYIRDRHLALSPACNARDTRATFTAAPTFFSEPASALVSPNPSTVGTRFVARTSFTELQWTAVAKTPCVPFKWRKGIFSPDRRALLGGTRWTGLDLDTDRFKAGRSWVGGAVTGRHGVMTSAIASRSVLELVPASSRTPSCAVRAAPRERQRGGGGHEVLTWRTMPSLHLAPWVREAKGYELKSPQVVIRMAAMSQRCLRNNLRPRISPFIVQHPGKLFQPYILVAIKFLRSVLDRTCFESQLARQLLPGANIQDVEGQLIKSVNRRTSEEDVLHLTAVGLPFKPDVLYPTDMGPAIYLDCQRFCLCDLKLSANHVRRAGGPGAECVTAAVSAAARQENESRRASVAAPPKHSPEVISENHGHPKSEWPDRESNPGPPKCEFSELPLTAPPRSFLRSDDRRRCCVASDTDVTPAPAGSRRRPALCLPTGDTLIPPSARVAMNNVSVTTHEGWSPRRAHCRQWCACCVLARFQTVIPACARASWQWLTHAIRYAPIRGEPTSAAPVVRASCVTCVRPRREARRGELNAESCSLRRSGWLVGRRSVIESYLEHTSETRLLHFQLLATEWSKCLVTALSFLEVVYDISFSMSDGRHELLQQTEHRTTNLTCTAVEASVLRSAKTSLQKRAPELAIPTTTMLRHMKKDLGLKYFRTRAANELSDTDMKKRHSACAKLLEVFSTLKQRLIIGIPCDAQD
ncbi:hypothetical protein PR048_003265 [Dryococelus australis]|uniref:Uncharacterized protein n=1 Tax=Dryococelus australis TaxID=614101 RepID=A0ABQ9IPQ3_9NEOP|nr:hypothetical protein PR048_003265 [Dryococelus australis]